MKIRFVVAALLLAPLCMGLAAGAARAQYLGQFGPLSPMGPGQKSVGAYLGSGTPGLGATGELRVNHSDRGTLGVQGGAADGIFALQADIRGGLIREGGDLPLTLGGELAGGLITGQGNTGIYVQAVPGLSIETEAGGGQVWAFWTGLGYRVTASKHKLGSGDTILRVGGRFGFSHELGLAANLEDVHGTAHLLVGAEYRFGGHGSSNVPGGK